MIRPVMLFIVLSLEVPCLCHGKEICTWVDTKGIRHFSEIENTPNTIKQCLSIQAPTVTPPPTDKTKASKLDNRSKNTSLLSINIISPTNGETIRDNTGSIRIKTELNRGLKRPEQLQLLMDNQPVGALSTKTVWQLENIDRGSHRFSIQLVVSGKVIASSSLVTIYLHRASVN